MDQNPPLQDQTATAVDPLAKEPSVYTIEKYNQVLQELPFSNTQDFNVAANGYLGTRNAAGVITNSPNVWDVRIPKNPEPPPSTAVWNLGDYAFLTPPLPTLNSPLSVNPSLWRQAKINMNNGLFHVTTRQYTLAGRQMSRGIYQVRAFDLSNMTIVEGDTGIIVIDPLISTQTAAAALQLYRHFRPQGGPVKAVIYTHSHIDHYGGVNGVITDPSVVGNGPGQISIYAPDGFLDHAISENAFAGNAMGRRATYMYGTFLPKNAKGEVDSGLGKGVSTGENGLIAPTVNIQLNYDPRVIDGVQVVFQLAQDTEAPSEMLFHFPQFKALCAAEDMTHNLHNVYSIRGSQVRDAMAWWKVINEAIKLFGDTTDVLFAQHHWPTWNTQQQPTTIKDYLKKQRDLYKYILDQSLRLLNHGRTMLELSEMIVLPNSLSQQWYNRGYYGTLNHDSKAVYQRYMGWYDANPANLHPLPPVPASQNYVDYMGGADSVLEKAQADFANGNYRWVAEVVNHVIFANPVSSDPHTTNPQVIAARNLQADALEQLGYQAESGPWRNAYLTGAYELRHGVPHRDPETAPLSPSVINAMTLDQYFDYMGLRFNAPKAEAAQLASTTINWIVNDNNTFGYYAMEFMDYTLPYTSYQQNTLPPAPITVKIDRDVLNSLADSPNPAQDFLSGVQAGTITVAGNVQQVADIFAMLDVFPADFNIVTPGQVQDDVP